MQEMSNQDEIDSSKVAETDSSIVVDFEKVSEVGVPDSSEVSETPEGHKKKFKDESEKTFFDKLPTSTYGCCIGSALGEDNNNFGLMLLSVFPLVILVFLVQGIMLWEVWIVLPRMRPTSGTTILVGNATISKIDPADSSFYFCTTQSYSQLACVFTFLVSMSQPVKDVFVEFSIIIGAKKVYIEDSSDKALFRNVNRSIFR